MLAFIVPLKHPKSAKSWELVSMLFERCLKSICNQTSLDYKVIVICNQKPNIAFDHPNVTYLEIDAPVPEAGNIEKRRKDKVYKLLTGLAFAQKYHPTHIMKIDADDCVSKHLAEFVSQNPTKNGWFVDSGYFYRNYGKFVYFRPDRFYRVCGTSSIIKTELHRMPEDLSYDAIDFDNFSLNWHYPHHKIDQIMMEQGSPIEPLPFPGAVYITDHGENHSNTTFDKLTLYKTFGAEIKRLRYFRLITQKLRDEFCLYSIG